jgi:hypothetical protein
MTPNFSARYLAGAALYHGTSWKNAERILADGFMCGKSRYPSKLFKPLHSGVYVTTDPNYALIYAIGGDYAGIKTGRNGHGAVFEVLARPDADVSIDEDQIGAVAVSGRVEWLKRLAEARTSKSKSLATVYLRALEGDYSAWVRLGKLLDTVIDDRDRIALIPHVSQFAVLCVYQADDVVVPIKCWRIDLSMTRYMKRHDWGSVLAVSERVL